MNLQLSTSYLFQGDSAFFKKELLLKYSSGIDVHSAMQKCGNLPATAIMLFGPTLKELAFLNLGNICTHQPCKLSGHKFRRLLFTMPTQQSSLQI